MKDFSLHKLMEYYSRNLREAEYIVRDFGLKYSDAHATYTSEETGKPNVDITFSTFLHINTQNFESHDDISSCIKKLSDGSNISNINKKLKNDMRSWNFPVNIPFYANGIDVKPTFKLISQSLYSLFTKPYENESSGVDTDDDVRYDDHGKRNTYKMDMYSSANSYSKFETKTENKDIPVQYIVMLKNDDTRANFRNNQDLFKKYMTEYARSIENCLFSISNDYFKFEKDLTAEKMYPYKTIHDRPEYNK